MNERASIERENLELQLLVEAVYRYYGFDFRDYAVSSLKRRLAKQMHEEGLSTLSGLQERLLHDEQCMERLLRTLSVHVTSMFRDPSFYLALREHALPLLRTYPSVRIWIAGCASGEEVYSVSILLAEEGLADRTRIYATDMNDLVLSQAKTAIYPIERMREYTQAYQQAGGRAAFSDYYHAEGEHVVMHQRLQRNIVFAQHNLAVDGPFNQFHLILCRNVMIYFNADLQARVVGLFRSCLRPLGLLALGKQETLRFSPHQDAFRSLDAKNKLYQRVD